MNLAQNPTEKKEKYCFYTLGLFVMYKLSSIKNIMIFYGLIP